MATVVETDAANVRRNTFADVDDAAVVTLVDRDTPIERTRDAVAVTDVETVRFTRRVTVAAVDVDDASVRAIARTRATVVVTLAALIGRTCRTVDVDVDTDAAAVTGYCVGPPPLLPSSATRIVVPASS